MLKQLSRCRRYSGLVLGSIIAGNGGSDDEIWDRAIQLFRSDDVEGIMNAEVDVIWKRKSLLAKRSSFLMRTNMILKARLNHVQN